MTKREELALVAEEHEWDLVFYEPAEVFDAAIVGVVHGFGQEPAVLYDQEKVLEGLRRQFDGDWEAATEWFDFNTVGAFVGDATPRFLVRRVG